MPDTYCFCRFRQYMVSGGEDGIAYFYNEHHDIVKTIPIDTQRGIQSSASTDDIVAFICFGMVRVFRFDDDLNGALLWTSDKRYIARSISFTNDSNLVVGTTMGVDFYNHDFEVDHHIPLLLMVMTIDVVDDLCAVGLECGAVYMISVVLKQSLVLLNGNQANTTDKYHNQPQCRWVKFYGNHLMVAVDVGMGGRLLCYDTTTIKWHTVVECDLWIMGGDIVTSSNDGSGLPQGSVVVALLQAVLVIDRHHNQRLHTWHRRHVVAVAVMGEKVMSAAMGDIVHVDDIGGPIPRVKRRRLIEAIASDLVNGVKKIV